MASCWKTGPPAYPSQCPSRACTLEDFDSIGGNGDLLPDLPDDQGTDEGNVLGQNLCLLGELF
jgi:hypothetical protein